MNIAKYWNSVADNWQTSKSQRLWRSYCDTLHTRLFKDWLPKQPVEFLLKTDMFDESVSIGLLPLLTSASQNVIGMDISTITLSNIPFTNAKFKTIGTDIRQLPFTDDTFDIAVSNSTLDHFESITQIDHALRQLHRVLKPGGRLLITLDNPINPIVALRNALPIKLLNKIGIVPYYVGATCGPGKLSNLLLDTGFQIQEIEAVMHCPRVLAVALGAILDRFASHKIQTAYTQCLMSMEILQHLPTRFLTGYFTAVKAIKI